jgi:single-strand selective monofunctional uracil DNA glycosylase
MRDPSDRLVQISRALSAALRPLRFADPVAFVYDPLDYARAIHEAYLRRFGEGTGRVVLLGMNPGPWGMAQTGVPFGEIAAVRDFLGLRGDVHAPDPEHPKRPVQGLDCPRSEVSGRRLWGWAQERYGTAEAFFEHFFVVNYCPLSFMEASGRNRTPDKLPVEEQGPLFEICDHALREMVATLDPRMVVGVGAFAEARAREALVGRDVPIGRVLHPSPASPAANRGWTAAAEKDFRKLGLLP